MTWPCGDCGTKWPDAVPTCITCLQRDLARTRELVEQAETDTERKVSAETRGRIETLTAALREARPYVYVACDLLGGRGETADGVLARVDAALAVGGEAGAG